MAFVPDASALPCLALRDERTAYGMSVVGALRDEGGLVRAIFRYEVRNALLVSVRRGRIEPARTQTFLTLLGELPLTIEALPSDAAVLQLGREHRLSVYDAS